MEKIPSLSEERARLDSERAKGRERVAQLRNELSNVERAVIQLDGMIVWLDDRIEKENLAAAEAKAEAEERVRSGADKIQTEEPK